MQQTAGPQVSDHIAQTHQQPHDCEDGQRDGDTRPEPATYDRRSITGCSIDEKSHDLQTQRPSDNGQSAIVQFVGEATQEGTEQGLQNSGKNRGHSNDQRKPKQSLDPLVQRDGEPAPGSERLGDVLFDPGRLDLVVEPGYLPQALGGEQPNRAILSSLYSVQDNVHIA